MHAQLDDPTASKGINPRAGVKHADSVGWQPHRIGEGLTGLWGAKHAHATAINAAARDAGAAQSAAGLAHEAGGRGGGSALQRERRGQHGGERQQVQHPTCHPAAVNRTHHGILYDLLRPAPCGAACMCLAAPCAACGPRQRHGAHLTKLSTVSRPAQRLLLSVPEACPSNKLVLRQRSDRGCTQRRNKRVLVRSSPSCPNVLLGRGSMQPQRRLITAKTCKSYAPMARVFDIRPDFTASCYLASRHSEEEADAIFMLAPVPPSQRS